MGSTTRSGCVRWPRTEPVPTAFTLPPSTRQRLERFGWAKPAVPTGGAVFAGSAAAGGGALASARVAKPGKRRGASDVSPGCNVFDVWAV
jgi:hypothetical protein